MIYPLQRGGNYGWSVYEGSHPFYLQRKLGPGKIVPPAAEHPHAEARCIIGGVFYQGQAHQGAARHLYLSATIPRAAFGGSVTRTPK